MNKPIGIFDSGIGGVTVLKEIIKILPNEKYIYYSDSLYNPYGDKTEKEIRNRSEQILTYFINQNCKAVVIACNTATAIAADYLRNKYKNLPIIAIEPAYKMVHDYSYNNPTLVMATKATIESERFNILLKKYNNNKTTLLSCIGLADIIEKGNEKEIKKYLKENLSKYKGKIKNIVLGCTHYPLIEKEIKEELGDEIVFFQGAERLAIHLKEILEEKNLLEPQSLKTEKNDKTKITFIDSSKNIEKEKRFFEILKNE